jgi:Flp pilus assembly protein TadG
MRNLASARCGCRPAARVSNRCAHQPVARISSRCARGENRFPRRRGGAVVELAVVTPLLLAMVFGVIEFGYVFMIQETLTTATREAARVAVLNGSTEQDIRNRFNAVVAPTRLTVAANMLTIQRATSQNPVETVTVSIPRSEVSLIGWFFGFTSGNISSSCSMRKEGVV